MFFADVPRLLPGTHGQCERDRRVALRCERKLELLPTQGRRDDRVLAHARDVQAPLVGFRPGSLLGRRHFEQFRVRAQRIVGPGVHVEQVQPACEPRVRQQFVQRRQGPENDAGQVLRRVPPIERRELADARVHAAQCEHRRERAVVGRSELHHARDAIGPLPAERHSGDDPAHAVTDQQHAVGACVASDARVQLGGKVADTAAPVVGVQACVEPGELERQLELEGVEQHGTERDQLGAARQRKPRQVPRGDFDQVHPQHVVEQHWPRDPRRDPMSPGST